MTKKEITKRMNALPMDLLRDVAIGALTLTEAETRKLNRVIQAQHIRANQRLK